MRLELDGAWKVRPVGDLAGVPRAIRECAVPARVPGCVHTDLLRAGLIEDPYVGEREKSLEWIGTTDWCYRRSFELPATSLRSEQVELVFDELDGVAAVSLNGRELGRAANAHHPHRFDARRALRPGTNTLEVVFESVVRHAREEEARLGPLPWLNTPDPFPFVRKMACNFGWDWGPTLVTCGMQGSVAIESWDGARIEHVRPLVLSAEPVGALVEVRVDTAGHAPEVAATLHDGAAVVASASGTSTNLTLEVEAPQLWWPRGYGRQPLYRLTVELSAAGEILDRWSQRIGLRTVRLDASEDEHGSRFTLEVNGRPVFCRGMNWIPDDCFLDRACEPERYRTRIGQAVAANANALRVWGGGIYERHAFYDVCDELGVIAWQDFAFACACYPEEAPHHGRVEREARHQVARLSRHPSLAVWNGCNENLWGFYDWDWQDAVQGRTWGAGYYFDLLPRICAELDPTRPYWPGSPYSGFWDPPNEPHPNASAHGNRHVWDPWVDGDHPMYDDDPPRFCSEYGFQGPPAWTTLTDAIETRTPKSFDDSRVQHHQRSEKGERAARELCEWYFGELDDIEVEHHLRQVVQARAVTNATEWFRSHMPTCMGAMYWQLNDCWPAMSWSAIDWAGRNKPLFHATRRFFADRLLTFQPGTEARAPEVLVAVNDSDAPWSETVVVQRVRFDGVVRSSVDVTLDVAPRTAARLCEVSQLVEPADPVNELLVVRASNRTVHRFLAPDRALAYPDARLELEVRGRADRYDVTVRAQSLVRELWLPVDRLHPDARASDGLVTLLPGESAALSIISPVPIEAEALRRIARCSNV